MRILYVTRKFPPSVGGLETAAYELYSALCTHEQVKLVKWGGSNRWLPIIYPWLTLCAMLRVWFWSPNVVYLQDGALAPMGVVLKLVSRRPIVISVHGLDLAYPNSFYQWLMRHSLRHINMVVTGSQWTRQQLSDRFPGLNTRTITYGLKDEFCSVVNRADVFSEFAIPTTGPLLLTVGRLVPRKGVEWFVANVMPNVVKQFPAVQYAVVGDGPMRPAIENAIRRHKLKKNVVLLGSVDNEHKKSLYNVADIFVMPNIPVADNGEGFGLVAVEASSCGTPVIASSLEGIKDAVKTGKNGYTLPPQDAGSFTQIIVRELKQPSLERVQVRAYTLHTYSWQKVAKRYLEAFKTV